MKSSEILKCTLNAVLITILIISCTNEKMGQKINNNAVKPYPHSIDISEGFNNPSEIKLSEIADSIKYLILSSDKEKVIGGISKIQISDNNIYVRARGSEDPIMKFDLTGKFINSFGSIGRGPKEYLPGSVYTTTPKDDKIIVFRSAMDSYLVFETNGDYVKTVDFPISRTMFDFRSLSDSVFLCTFYYFGSIMKDYISNSINCIAGIFDSNGEPIEVIEHPLKDANLSESDTRNVVSMAPSFTFFDNRIVLMPDGDTIYEIGSKSISKGYIINWGNIPHKKIIGEYYYKQTETSNKVSISPIILETFDRTFFIVTRDKEYYLFEYNKVSGSTRSMAVDVDNIGLINDLDGGDNYFTYYTNRAGDIWLNYEDAYNFIENHSPEVLNNSIAVNPSMKEKLKTFVNNLKKDDNPVIKIVYLKNPSITK